MKKKFDSDAYYAYLAKVDDKYGLDLDWRHYESFTERSVNLEDLPSIPNAISVAGLAMVVDGCRDISTVNGVNKIAIGRGLDLFDGSIARWLDQSSDMGAIVDVTCDKLGMGAIYLAAKKEQAIPAPFLQYVLAKHLAHSALTFANGYLHPAESFRPPKSGKIAMLGENLAGGAFLYANAYKNEQPEKNIHTGFRAAGTALAAASIIPGAVALRDLSARLSK